MKNFIFFVFCLLVGGACVETSCMAGKSLFRENPVSSATTTFLEASQCDYFGAEPQAYCTEEDKNDGTMIEGTTKPVKTTPTTKTTKEPITDDDYPALTKKPKTLLLPKVPEWGNTTVRVCEFREPALLQYRKPNSELEFHCGGAVINNRYVLTAAHCLRKIPSTWELVSVRIGERDFKPDKHCKPCLPSIQDIKIAKAIVHPKYKENDINSHYDLALLKLEDEIKFSEFIKPNSPFAKQIWNKHYSKQHLIAAGWGFQGITENTTRSTRKLFTPLPFFDPEEGTRRLFTTLPFFDREECQKFYAGRRTENDHMCAVGIIENDGCCKGDAGGPLLPIDDPENDFGPTYIAGIVPYGDVTCGFESYPKFYTKVAYYLEWIVDIIRE